jgi:RNA polymerase sigma factor (sigma-70 family)
MPGDWVNQIVASSDYVGVTGNLGSIGKDCGSEREVLESPRPVRVPDEDAFDGFYAREYPSLVALARVLMGPSGPAEDVAQEAMLAAYRRWDEVAAMEFPAAWIRRVCANIATSLVRRKIVEARALTTLRGRTERVAAVNDGASAFWGEVRRLPRRQAQCLALYYLYGCSVKETAVTLGCSEGTVKTHLARGRTAVASRLDLSLEGGSGR